MKLVAVHKKFGASLISFHLLPALVGWLEINFPNGRPLPEWQHCEGIPHSVRKVGIELMGQLKMFKM